MPGPRAGFFLWLPVAEKTRRRRSGPIERRPVVRILPGGYFGRDVDGRQPGCRGMSASPWLQILDELRRGLILLRGCLYKE